MSEARKIFQLNGEWELQPAKKTKRPASYNHSVSVPGLVDLSKPSLSWNEYDYFWYRKIITMPVRKLWETIYLKIGQASFGTEVWINGNHAGGDIACYTSQKYSVEGLLDYGRKNEILIRVGAKHTLPDTSAVGNDYEKTEFIPGIWGDINLICHDNPGIENIQVIPHIEKSSAEVNIEIVNNAAESVDCNVKLKLLEKNEHKSVSDEMQISSTIPAGSSKIQSIEIPLRDMKLWSPESPFLYEVRAQLFEDGSITDEDCATFGMREFRIHGGDFFLNGEKIYLRGGNIAFHRFLSDPERGHLPWNEEWIKHLLVDIPKNHHFNFFRNHLGQLYNKWYDIADEHGMLIQNEWQFWGVTGSKEQIAKEFTQWLKDNWNHPSIVIWDALNETRNEMVEQEIIPALKKLDPTRPWEPVDFIEDHPYIYSLGPVLNDRRIGFTRALKEIENLPVPSVLNEFVWWWLDEECKPTELTQKALTRWMGPEYTAEALVDHQCFLVQELVELFRRMKVDAIQPFVYLSNNNGPTAHWFLSPVKDLKPKPILKQLKNAFEPFGVSIELWDRHFFESEKRKINVYVFNDSRDEREGILKYGITGENGKWIKSESVTVNVPPVESVINSLDISIPEGEGTYYVKAELLHPDSQEVISYSRKIAHVFQGKIESKQHRNSGVIVLDSPSGEITDFLNAQNSNCKHFLSAKLNGNDTVVVAEGMVRHDSFIKRINEVSSHVQNGGTLVLIEPEFNIEEKHVLSANNGIEIDIERRADTDQGGYDSYVFPVERNHPLWNGIEPEHLKMFNGAYGGEVISQHNVIPRNEHTVLARCGLQLNVIAAAEIPAGKGSVILSRLQLRGRLMEKNSTVNGLYERRVDPVAQRYFLNLISFASE